MSILEFLISFEMSRKGEMKPLLQKHLFSRDHFPLSYEKCVTVMTHGGEVKIAFIDSGFQKYREISGEVSPLSAKSLCY